MNQKVLLGLMITLGLVIGFIAGFTFGLKQGISWCVDMGIKFLNSKGIQLDVDTEMLKNAIFNYKEQINSCFTVKPVQEI